MAVILYENGDFPVFKSTDALEAGGYILKLNSDGTVSKATATDEVFGINVAGVVDYLGNPVPTPEVAILLAGRATIVYLQLDPANLAISIRDPLCVDATTAGVVDLKDDVENTGARIAIALEAKAANSGGVIKALLL